MNYAMFNKSYICFFTFIILLPHHLSANEAKFAIKGAGAATCEQFLNARKNKSKEYYVFGGWIDGFISGLNQNNENIFDLTPWQSTDLLVESVSRYCQIKPEESFFRTTATMLQAQLPTALSKESTTTVAKYNNRAIIIYKDIVKRMQYQLNKENLFQHDIDGEFNEHTIEALKAYQKKYGLKITGLPDQMTLFYVFTKRSSPEFKR